MQAFLDEQPIPEVSATFRKLEIYEYTEAKPSLYTLLPSTLRQMDIKIDTSTSLDKTWNFSSIKTSVESWQKTQVANTSTDKPKQ